MHIYLVAWQQAIEYLSPPDIHLEGDTGGPITSATRHFFTVTAGNQELAEAAARRVVELIALDDHTVRLHSVTVLGPATIVEPERANRAGDHVHYYFVRRLHGDPIVTVGQRNRLTGRWLLPGSSETFEDNELVVIRPAEPL